MFDTVYTGIGVSVAVIVLSLAFLKGDEPERTGAGAFAIGLLASLLLQNVGQAHGPQWGLLLVDGILLAVYAGLAWKSRRSWPVWATAFQTVIVASHLLSVVDLRPPAAAFYAVINLASYGILGAVLLGTLRAWSDRRTPPMDPPGQV